MFLMVCLVELKMKVISVGSIWEVDILYAAARTSSALYIFFFIAVISNEEV